MDTKSLSRIALQEIMNEVVALKQQLNRPLNDEEWLFWKQAEGLSYLELKQHLLNKLNIRSTS